MLSASGVALANSFNKDNNPTIVFADGDEPQAPDISGYTYTEHEGHLNEIVRVYDDSSLAPIVNRKFCAPSGLVLTLSISDELLDIWFAIFDSVQASYLYEVPVFQYETFGSIVYSSSDVLRCNPAQEIDVRRTLVREQLASQINNYVLFEAKEIVVGTTVKVVFDIEIDTLIPSEDDFDDTMSYTFRFTGEEISLEPYDEYDFISLHANYYDRASEGEFEQRITVFCDLIPGFFNDGTHAFDQYGEEGCYNEFGFLTDTTIYSEDPIKGNDGYVCKYDLNLFAFGSIPLGTFVDQDNHRINSIQLDDYPVQVLPITAKLSFVSGGQTYVFYSKTINIGNLNTSILIDGYQGRSMVEIDAVHEYKLNLDVLNLDRSFFTSVRVTADPIRLQDSNRGYDLFDNPVLPEVGEVNKYYYIPSEHEIELHNQGKDAEIYNSPAEGYYYIWDAETQEFKTWGMSDFEHDSYEFLLIDSMYDPESGEEFDYDSLFSNQVAFKFLGEYRFYITLMSDGEMSWVSVENSLQYLYVIKPYSGKEEIILDVPDEVNLIQGAGKIEITPTVDIGSSMGIKFYYDFDISRDDIIDVSQSEDGVLTLNPLTHGIVDLTIYMESDVFAKISKTITIRVLDSVFGVSKVVVPNEFHYAGKDLTVSVAVRGFTNIQNLDIDWNILGKDGKEISENKYEIHNDATITINKAASNDYQVTASYEGIEIGTIKVQVRQININQFVRQNIWWVVLITIAFVFVVLFMQKLLRGGITTVQAIDNVYSVFCSCISDDRLTLAELKIIRRALKRCIRRCEDLNIESLNQYEKAIRYLRKSYADTTNLIKKWENISVEDKSAFTEKLNLDLAKALNVAREIENAKELIEKYHMSANKKNYETGVDPNSTKSKK